jgi:hypothetical protein
MLTPISRWKWIDAEVSPEKALNIFCREWLCHFSFSPAECCLKHGAKNSPYQNSLKRFWSHLINALRQTSHQFHTKLLGIHIWHFLKFLGTAFLEKLTCRHQVSHFFCMVDPLLPREYPELLGSWGELERAVGDWNHGCVLIFWKRSEKVETSILKSWHLLSFPIKKKKNPFGSMVAHFSSKRKSGYQQGPWDCCIYKGWLS